MYAMLKVTKYTHKLYTYTTFLNLHPWSPSQKVPKYSDGIHHGSTCTKTTMTYFRERTFSHMHHLYSTPILYLKRRMLLYTKCTLTHTFIEGTLQYLHIQIMFTDTIAFLFRSTCCLLQLTFSEYCFLNSITF